MLATAQGEGEQHGAHALAGALAAYAWLFRWTDGFETEHASAWPHGVRCWAPGPGTARVFRGLLAVLDSPTETGRRIAGWQGLTLKDAMPLRIAGGFHHLVLTGADHRLADVYAGRITDQAAVDALVLDLAHQFDARLLPWLDGPPQTNEAGRSASIMAGLLWLAQRVRAPRFDLFELGASAGVNTMLDRYFFQLGETAVGPPDSPMRIVPEWRGASPPMPPTGFAMRRVKGCDIAPINLADPDAALPIVVEIATKVRALGGMPAGSR